MSDRNSASAIIAATERLLVARGAVGVSYRGVAAEAHVSVGMINYFFPGKEDLIFAALERFTDRSATQFAAYFAGVPAAPDTFAAAQEATTRMLIGSAQDMATVALGTELYSLAVRRPRFFDLTREWSRTCRAVMQQFFDRDTTLMLDAYYEGMLLNIRLEHAAYTADVLGEAVRRITGRPGR